MNIQKNTQQVDMQRRQHVGQDVNCIRHLIYKPIPNKQETGY